MEKKLFKFIVYPCICICVILAVNISEATESKEEKGALIKLWEGLKSRYFEDAPESESDTVPVETPNNETFAEPKNDVEYPKNNNMRMKQTIEGQSLKAIKQKNERTKKLFRKEELVTNIESKIRQSPQLQEIMPEIYFKKSVVTGEVSFYYQPSEGDIPVKLNDLSKKELYNLMFRIDDITKKIERGEYQPAEKFSPIEEPVSDETLHLEKTAGSEEAKGTVVKKQPEESKKREIPFSAEEMIDVIKKRVTVFSQIPFMIPNFIVKDNEAGEKECFYETEEGKVVSLEELDKETLHNLFIRVNNEATVLQTQRIIRQVEQQQQEIRMIQSQQQQVRQQVMPPQVPNVYVPPQPPQIPQPVKVYEPPKVYIPPQPPKVYIPPQPPSVPGKK